MANTILKPLFARVLPNYTSSVRFQAISASKLLYSEYGDPVKVVQKLDEELKEVKKDEVLVKMLAAPVNPADINTIQGKYPSRPELPAIPGNEGVAEVVETGDCVTNVVPGDRVVPLTNMMGTWRSHAVLPSSQVFKVPKELGLVEASTLTVNPCTAYRMIKDFTTLKTGDVVIQNGANSACGQNVIQLCRIWGLKSINIIRDRPNVAELKEFLKHLGATEVLTEEEIRKTQLFKNKQLPKPKLALNCVGGQSALEIMRHLDHGSPMVTYGGMSRQPVTLPTSAFIFKDIQVHGFWMTQWANRNAGKARMDMLDELIAYMIKGDLQVPAYKMVDFENYRDALMNTMTIKGMTGLKYILGFDIQ